jgi:hypothetical protein
MAWHALHYAFLQARLQAHPTDSALCTLIFNSSCCFSFSHLSAAFCCMVFVIVACNPLHCFSQHLRLELWHRHVICCPTGPAPHALNRAALQGGQGR